MKTLLQHGAGVNFTGPGSKESPLHIAVIQDCEEIVALLLQNNADANGRIEVRIHSVYVIYLSWQVIQDGPPPLFGTLRTGSCSVARLLLDHGADVNARQNISVWTNSQSVIVFVSLTCWIQGWRYGFVCRNARERNTGWIFCGWGSWHLQLRFG